MKRGGIGGRVATRWVAITDEANRAVFSEDMSNEDNTVGIALRADKKIVDKVIKGTKMHS